MNIYRVDGSLTLTTSSPSGETAPVPEYRRLLGHYPAVSIKSLIELIENAALASKDGDTTARVSVDLAHIELVGKLCNPAKVMDE